MSDHYDRYNGMENLLGTNLAEVGTDVPDNNVGELISREQAIEVLERAKQNIHHNIERAIGDAVCEVLDAVENGIKQLPPIQPVIVPCDYAKACNEATMNELTSAVAYYDVLEELRKHGYVLVDMREVNNESN